MFNFFWTNTSCLCVRKCLFFQSQHRTVPVHTAQGVLSGLCHVPHIHSTCLPIIAHYVHSLLLCTSGNQTDHLGALCADARTTCFQLLSSNQMLCSQFWTSVAQTLESSEEPIISFLPCLHRMMQFCFQFTFLQWYLVYLEGFNTSSLLSVSVFGSHAASRAASLSHTVVLSLSASWTASDSHLPSATFL